MLLRELSQMEQGSVQYGLLVIFGWVVGLS
jgi:hypothetical protein